MKKIILSIFILTLIVGSGASNVFAVPDNTNTGNFVDVIVSFDRIPGETERGIFKAFGGEITHSFTIIPAVAGSLPEKAISALERNPHVTAVELDLPIYAVDYEASNEYGNAWGATHIEADVAHNEGYLGDSIKVAVIDSGVDYNHRDLAANFDPDDLGYDFVEDDDDPMDVYGHGTHVAGTVAAANNEFGVVGVAPEVQIISLRILDDDGVGSSANTIAALEWIMSYNEDSDNPIRITNNSYGRGTESGPVRDAFDASTEAGVLHVAAAGNSGNPAGRNDSVIYPAKYESVVAVSAVDKDNKRPSWSSTGPDVELVAPGVSVLSTWNSSTSYADPQPFSFDEDDSSYYKEGSGTSMSSPHVAGTAALAWAISPGLNNTDVRQILRDTAQDLGNPNRYGYGLVRADLAVEEVAGVEVAEVAITPVEQEGQAWPGDDAVYDFTVENVGDTEDTYDLSVSSKWDSSVELTSVTLGAGESTTVEITHSIPEDASAGDTETGTVEAVSGNSGSSASAEFITTARGYTVEIIPESQEDSGAPGDTAEYVYTLSNIGTEDDSYNLEVTEASWETSISTSSVMVVAGGSVDVTVSHTIPDEAKDGDFDTGILTAVSQTDDTVSASATFTTTAKTVTEVTTVSVVSINYAARGGRNKDKHLDITAVLEDDLGDPVADASVSATLHHEDGSFWGFQGTTGSDGTVVFTLANHDSDCYWTEVTAVDAEGLEWDGETPENNYCK